MSITKPMLAGTVHSHELENVEWPVLASPKLDGIRCINHPAHGPVTRSFKPVANVHIRETLEDLCLEYPMDGELIVLDNHEPADFNTTQSGVMSRGGRPDFVYAVFDVFPDPEAPYEERIADALTLVQTIASPYVEFVDHRIIKDIEEFTDYAHENIRAGYEGTMIRSPQGPYKNGRSTRLQGWLLKYKEWADAEGTLVGIEEKMHNANEDIKDNFGYAKRTSHKANLVPTGTMGALVLETEWGELRVGTGFDDAQRKEIWDSMQWSELEGRYITPYFGKLVTFKYQSFGMLEKPRFPVFMRFREQE